MGETEISWTHRPGTVGRSWNPGQGCSLVSEGCRNCYAMRLAARFAANGWSKGLINLKTKKWNGEVRLAVHKLLEPTRWRKPSTVFVNSMTDIFHEGYSNEQIAAVFGIMAACGQHTFQILTKRAKRMREWFAWVEERIEEDAEEWSGRECGVTIHDARADERSWLIAHCAADEIAEGSEPLLEEWTERLTSSHGDTWARDGADGGTELTMPWPLPNVWLGVSVENQEAAEERIPELLKTPAAIRFLSCEPLIGEVNLRCIDAEKAGHDDVWFVDALTGNHDDMGRPCARLPRIDWVIVGCESGPGARPCEVAWLTSLRNQCAAAGVAFFAKQAMEIKDVCNECGESIRYYAHSPSLCDASCGCTVEGPETCDPPPIAFGEGSKRKGGGLIDLPYLDGVQHAAFPEAP